MDRRFQLHGTRVLFIARSFIRSIRVASRISVHDVVQIKAVAYKLATTTSHTSGTDTNQNNHHLNLSETARHDMGSEGCDARKPRFLCLHGFRTSGLILKTQLGKWPESVLRNFDLVFLDGPFPAQGKSDVEGIFEPPYYEWFQFNKVRKTKHISNPRCFIFCRFIYYLLIFWVNFDGFFFPTGIFRVHKLWQLSWIHWRLHDQEWTLWRAAWFFPGIYTWFIYLILKCVIAYISGYSIAF